MELAQPSSASFVQVLFQMGIFGGVYIILAVFLVIGFTILFLRDRSRVEYLAYIALAIYPMLLGILGGALSVLRWMRVLGNSGIADPGAPTDPILLAQCLSEILFRVIGGSALTCLFFPLGILALLIRRPK